MEKEIIWSKAAKNQLEKIYFHIFKESKSRNISNKVIETIYSSVTIVKTNWEIY
ncbi:hypothetical protein [Flavobacterium ginsenosidimutans]|uniref:hypothetical protein n=1 Tax=Flavobacterium ginsenosidimutans TaxID=687844 RepID=UPI003D958F5E